jgi:hypothetical protein
MVSEQPEQQYSMPTEEPEHRVTGSVFIELMQAVLSKGRAFRFEAAGISMTPFIRDKDVLTIAPVSSKAVGIGDVVAYRVRQPRGERLVVHRLVGRQGRHYLIQGDLAANLITNTARKSDLLGRVVLIERCGKRVRFGLGPERYLIAALSRFGLLPRVLRLRLVGEASSRATRRRRP